MDAPRLKSLLNNTYIPPEKKHNEAKVPNYHPCLIVQDKQTDNKVKPCGCADAYCVKNAPEWIPRAEG